MKDQYFGDVNDFRKYGLLRALAGPDRLRLGLCWMLTGPDGRADGKFLAYLGQPKKYRHRDPELFDWLRQVVGEEKDLLSRLLQRICRRLTSRYSRPGPHYGLSINMV